MTWCDSASLSASQIWTTHPSAHLVPADGSVWNMCCFLNVLQPLLSVPVRLRLGSVWAGAQLLLA